ARSLRQWNGERSLVGTRRQRNDLRQHATARSHLRDHGKRWQTRGEATLLRDAVPPEWHRVQGRHTLHRRVEQNLEGRAHRRQSRQSAKTGRDLQRPAERRAAWLEISDHWPRQQALFPGRRALQSVYAAPKPYQVPPYQYGWQRRRSDRPRDSTDRRDGPPSSFKGALL